MKKCLTCKEFKESREFSKDKSRKDELYPYCKICNKIYRNSHKKERKSYQNKYYQEHKEERKANIKAYRQTHREGRNARDKIYRQTLKGKEIIKKWRKNNPKKHKAHGTLYNAIASGKVIKPNSCSICSKTECRIEGHHDDYNKPLKVVWCCKQCHVDIHKLLTKKKP